MKEQIDYSSQIGTLINLQKIDTQIYALCREKEEIPRMFEKLKEIAEEEKLKIKDAEDDLKALQVKRKDKEIDLASKEENIKKLQTQLFQIKTNKEYTAMQKEIEGLKADNSVLEEEILLMMEEQDKAKKEIDDVKQGVTEKEKEYIESVIKADFQEAGDEDVFRKIKADLKGHNISDEDIRKKMKELDEKAKSDFI